jgi:hypothetical protein
VDRAVFDEDGRFLSALLKGAPRWLAPRGQLLLLLSDLAVRLGLREPAWLEAELELAGLTVQWLKTRAATHGRARDRADPLHAARSREVLTLYSLGALSAVHS